MANFCVNKSLPEFIKLQEETGLNPVILQAKISLWMEKNGMDNFPTLEDLQLLNNNVIFENIIKDKLSNEFRKIDTGENGDNISNALRYLTRGESTGSKIEKTKSEQEEEDKLVKDFIIKNDLIFKDKLNQKNKIAEGSEQEVYLDKKGNRVYKVNSIQFFNFNYISYLQNLVLHNTIFPETKYTLEGFIQKENYYFPVVSQKFIKSDRGADNLEVSNFLKNFGFINTKNNDYKSENLGLILEDLHDENVLVKNDKLFFIDTVFYLKNNINTVIKSLVKKSKNITNEDLSNELGNCKL